MKTLKDHQDTMVSMLASGTAIPTSAIRLAHALHDVLAHLNNTNVAPMAHTERRIDATTTGLNDVMLSQDIAAVTPKQHYGSLLKQRDNTIRQLKGRVADLVKERAYLVARLGPEETERLAEQAGCRKEDTEVPDDGWIEWDGGECPVADDTPVDIRFRTGTVIDNYAAVTWDWNKSNMPGAVVAYRVVKS